MPNLYATNKTSSPLTVTSCTVHFIDSTDASLVTVYDGNDAPCDAFQYSLSGVPWWYVLDGVHDAWVDDLSSIGYHLPTVLPTVTLANAYVYSASDPSTMTIWAGNNFVAKDASGNSIGYNASLLYNAYASYADTSSPIWFNNGWTPIESSGLLAIMNNASSGSRTVHHVCYATCSDLSATVVTVYNSSNVAYNAFKFTASGTDYYYVLDGTQTDWTDDLASIGYYRPIAFLRANKGERDVAVNTLNYLYDDSGVPIKADSSKTYTLLYLRRSDGTAISYHSSIVTLEAYTTSGTTYLMLSNSQWGTVIANVCYCEYTVS